MVAGGDESGHLGSRVSVGAHDIGVHDAHLASERRPDSAGVGVGWHPEPSGSVHDLVIMARLGHRPAVEAGLGRRLERFPLGPDDARPAGPESQPEIFLARGATFEGGRHLRQVGREQSAPKGGGAARQVSQGASVSRAQYAFIVGVLLVWFAWAAGWVVLAGIAAGLIGWGIVRVLEGDVDLGEIGERFKSTSGRPPR
jgi:hypothetical protein